MFMRLQSSITKSRLFSTEKIFSPSSSVMGVLDSQLNEEDLLKSKFLRRSKLNKSLAKPQKIVLDESSEGILDALAGELEDAINDYLNKNSIFVSGPTKQSLPISSNQLVEITRLRLNQDCSHAHAYWSSSPIEILLEKMLEKSKEQTKQTQKVDSQSMQRHHQIGIRMEKKVTDVLQFHEGKFRSHIIRSINLRRVPRIFFAPDNRYKLLLDQLQKNARV
jgi:ribosome-binding factor A